MESENRLEFDTTLATFDHPRYELIATGDVHDGPQEVMDYFEESRDAFPDQRNELIELHHAGDAVIAEFMLKGTHLGNYRGLPATGRPFECRMCAIFVFERRPARLRAGLLRHRHDPAPARHRPRPADVDGSDRHDRQSPGDDRQGAGPQHRAAWALARQ